ncbi:MAG: TRAP transporter large permease subunit [Verrucomicrobiales bacterium]|nr:TRAP transporter large permease subunit [Verrucomicrobiales bacterium]
MSVEFRLPEATAGGEASKTPQHPWLFWLARFENGLLVALLFGMLLIPLAQVLRRWGLPVGIEGSEAFLSHFNLLVGVFGGLVAARENRLLSLSTLPNLLPKPWMRRVVAAYAHTVAAAIAAVLCMASVQLVLAERQSGRELAYGIPIWVAQAALPLGFGCLALRMLWHAGPWWWWRAAAAWCAAGIVGIGLRPPTTPSSLVIPALVGLFLGALAGTPIFALLGGAAIILFWGREDPLASIPLDHYEQVVNPLLPMVPLFTLTGYYLAESGASKRLVRVFLALFGSFRGGPAIVTALVCAFFTTFTGGSGVTILALGGLLYPVLTAAKYSDRDALGLLTGAGSLGILLPPCLPLILYAIVADIPIPKMFLGGIVPGLLLVGLTAAWGVRAGPKLSSGERTLDWAEIRSAVWEAKWELLLPVVAFAGLFFCLPAEAAALTALYALVVETVVHRDLRPTRDVPRVMTECGLLVGGVLLILGVAMGFTNFLITAQVPDKGVEWVRGTIQSPWVFLIALNVFLLIVGCLMDIFSAIIVVVPLIVPIGLAFGIDPVHLGIIFLANLELGYLTPPVGMNLFLSSYRFGKPMPEVTRAAFPMLGVLFVGVLLITYIPALTTWLPRIAR